MQCLTFMIEEGNAQLREGKLGSALRRYKSVQDVSSSYSESSTTSLTLVFQTFNDIENDQFDFHNYSLRRYSMNIYLK